MTNVLLQKNRYKGKPSRPWIRLLLKAQDNTAEELQLLADTGNPCAIVISTTRMAQFKRANGPKMSTNFGLLTGGWLQIVIPELKIDKRVLGYANDAVVAAAKASSPDFEGLAGLPLLQLLEYGGNADWFWIK